MTEEGLTPALQVSATASLWRSSAPPSLILGDSAEEMHERLVRCAKQVEQLRTSIRRYTDLIAAGEDVDSAQRSLVELRTRLDEHLRKQKLTIEEHRQQVSVLEAAVAREETRLSGTETALQRVEALFRAGNAVAEAAQQARLAHKDAFVAFQSAKAMLGGFREAGRGQIVDQESAEGGQ